MRDAVIVDAVRAPIGRRKGTLKGVHPVDLSASVLTALAARNQLDPELIEDIVWGCVTQIADQSTNVGRLAVLAAGWPETIPGVTLDRACGSASRRCTSPPPASSPATTTWSWRAGWSR